MSVYLYSWPGRIGHKIGGLVSILLELISSQAPNEKNNKVVGCSDVERVFLCLSRPS